jgi:hypothetical protein
MRHYLYLVKGWPVVEVALRADDPRRMLVGIYDDDREFVQELRMLLEQAAFRATRGVARERTPRR